MQLLTLNDFGFDITARGVQFQQHPLDVYDGNFEMAIRNWGLGDPIPARSYLEAYNRYNGQGELAGEGVGGGMNFRCQRDLQWWRCQCLRPLECQLTRRVDRDCTS